MSLEAWFWIVFIVVATAECIRQYRLLMKALAIPDEWLGRVADHDAPKEGDHASDQQSP